MSEPIVTRTELESLLAKPEKDFILIDVRERQEIADTGMIPTAHNVPRSFFISIHSSTWNSVFSLKLT